MLYLESDGGTKVVVLSSENLEKLKQGKPAVTPDKKVCVCYTPDIGWLAEEIAKVVTNEDGDANKIGKLIDESTKRPEKPVPDYFPPKTTRFKDKK
jgi:hypothetical protein